jgi:hypothetical protein
MIIAEVLAYDGDLVTQRRLLKQLYELHLWRGGAAIQATIIAGIRHLGVMSGLDDSRLACLVAETSWQLCWHLVGPDMVPWQKESARLVNGAIAAIGNVGQFNAFDTLVPRVGKAVAHAMLNCIRVGVGYRKRDVVDHALHEMREIIAAAQQQQPGKARKRRAFLAEIRRLLQQVERIVTEAGPSWNRQRAVVRQLLGRAG